MCQKIKIKNCIYCSESFEAKRKNHCYCSASCRVMACYKRKGYRYISGRYEKPKLDAMGALTAVPLSPIPISVRDTPTNVQPQAEPQEKTSISSKGMSGSGVMESVVGAGMVAASKYLLHDRHLIEMVRELHEALVAHPRRLQQQPQRLQHQMGMGMNQSPKLAKPVSGMQPAPKPKPSTSLTSHQLNLERLGLDPGRLNEGKGGFNLME